MTLNIGLPSMSVRCDSTLIDTMAETIRGYAAAIAPPLHGALRVSSIYFLL